MKGNLKGSDVPPHAHNSDLVRQIEEFIESAHQYHPEDDLDRPAFGVTLYIAKTKVEMQVGTFTAYIFQDIIHKGYIVALAYGGYNQGGELYTRIHSSCVTSETLRGCDCDCVQQLEGAIQKIAETGKGVLFYLLQEGRGVGYTAKARDRMLVQASQDTVSTFDAYRMLGLRKDYRQYRNIRDICTILSLMKADWVVLTNNPDKVEALQGLGLNVARSESLEYEPQPYNLAYLKSKAESGHELKNPKVSTLESVQTPELVVPFKPRAIENARRFVYMARYYLPIRPVDDNIVVTPGDYQQVFPQNGIDDMLDDPESGILSAENLRNNRLLIEIDRAVLDARRLRNPEDPVCRLLYMPYWFKAHVYFDIVSGNDFVVLTHGTMKIDDYPVVRIQSESIMNRFPLQNTDNRVKYIRTLEEIIDYGSGAIILNYHDGRGAGFGAFATDRMMMQEGSSANSKESYQKLGVGYDERDYDGLFIVLKEHLPSNRIQMVMNSPTSLVTKPEYAEALNRHALEVENWIFLDEPTTER